MKKSILSLLLAVVFTFGATQGMVSAFASVEADKDTPVAKIASNDYVPYNNDKNIGEVNVDEAIDNVNNQVRSVGGYAKKYASEEDYLNESSVVSTASSKDFNNVQESVKQIFKVMTTATGSIKNNNYVDSKAISNAIVRINGVPRYTDRNGEIRVTLNKFDYIELFVEKEGYNPYIEVMEVTGEDKIIHIKQPSDNIDIYDVELNYSGKISHVLNQKFYIMRDLDESCYSSITINSNIIYDETSSVQYESYLLVNGELESYQKGNTISNIYFDDYLPTDKFSVYIVYDGIKSKTYDLLLNVVEVPEDEEDNSRSGGNSEENSTWDFPIGNDKLGLFSGFNLNFRDLKKLKELLFPNQKGTLDLDLECAYNYYTGVLTLSAGLSFEKFKEAPSDKERYKAMKEEVKKYKKDQKEQKNQKKQLNKELAEAQKKYDKYKDSMSDAELKRLENEVNNWKSKIDEANKDENKSSHYFKTMAARSNELLAKEQESQRAKESHARQLFKDVEDGKKKIQDLDQELSKIPGLIKQARQAFNQCTKGVVVGININGIIDIDIHERKILNVNVSVGASIGVKVKGAFMAWVIPMFYEVSAGFEITITCDVKFGEHLITLEEFLTNILVELAIKGRAEIGVGVNDVLGLSVYAQLRGGVRLYPLASGEMEVEYGGNRVILEDWPYLFNPASWGFFLEWRVALRLEIFIFSWELGYDGDVDKPEYEPNHKIDRTYSLSNDNLIGTASYMSRSANITNENKYDFDHIYQNSKPQLVQVNGQAVLFWIEDSPLRDNYNRTILKYSICENGEWSEPKSVYDDGRADFSHNVYVDGNELYVTWQKGNRQFTESDDYISMGKDCDIFVAKYDKMKKSFVNVENISNDGDLDFAPKFALKENNSNPLTIMWQKNSVNDMLGMAGVNSLVYSTMDNGKWSKPIQTYQTEKYISFVTSAYSNGSLTTAFIENQTGDYSNKNDYSIKLFKNNNESYIAEAGSGATNPQFNIKDGKARLFYYSEDRVVFTEDFVNTLTFASMEAEKINDTFNIVSTDNGYAFFYNAVNGDYVQPMCALYNEEISEWSYNISLSNELNNTSNAIGLLSNDNKIMAVYNIHDDQHNTAMNYAEIDLLPDFSIENVFYNMDAQEGDIINLNLGIFNSGKVNLSNFKVQAFGQTVETISKVSIGEYSFINVDINFEKNNDIEVIKVISNGVERSYELRVQYSDIRMDGNVIVKSNEQFFNLSILNVEAQDETIELIVYKSGAVVYNETITVKGASIVEKELYFKNLQVGDELFFEIKTNDNDRYQIDNRVILKSILDTTVINEFSNPYYNVLEIAKGVLYGEE